MSDEWLQEANEICATVARQVHRKYAVYFDVADVQQELMLWCLNKQDKVCDWLDVDNVKEASERKIGIKMLAKSLNREAERYCRSRKAKSVGYETRDEAFYTMGMLEELISHMDELENMSTQQAGNVRVSNGGSDPATGNNYLASVLDVRSALAKLDPIDAMLVDMKYKESMTLAQIANVVELSDSTISRRIHRALRQMVKELGGDNPWGGGVGNSHRPSSAEGRAMISDS